MKRNPANAANATNSSSSAWLPWAVLVGITFLAYLPVWRAGFIWDDDTFLTNNRLIKESGGLFRFWFTTAAPDYFPLTSTSLWLEWRLWGMNPLGYHLVNVLLHAMSAVLWWRVLARLKLPGAWLAAAIFAVHPVNVESVAWITERKNTLAMFFYALTLLWFVKSEETNRRNWYWASVGFFLLALLSKTSVTPLPVVLLGLAWWRRGKVTRQDCFRSAPFFVLSVVLGLVTMWFQAHRAIGGEIIRHDALVARLAAAGSAVWFYLYKALVPLNLSFAYPRWQIDATNVLAYVPLVLLLAALGVCWWQRGRWGQGLFFGLGYFVLLLLPVLGFIEIYFMRYSLVADHWQYFSIIAVAAAVAVGLEKGFGLNRYIGEIERVKKFWGVFSAGILLGLGVLTWRQCANYVNEGTLWRATLAQNPRSYLALNNLGSLLVEQGKAADAVPLLQRALEVEPGFAEAHHNFGNAFLKLGQLEEAFRSYQKAVEIEPSNALAQNNLGSLLLKKDKPTEAIPHFQAALKARPDFAEAYYNLGNAQLQLGANDEALVSFQKTVVARTNYAAAHNNIGNILFGQGKTVEAIQHLQRALASEPDNISVRENLTKAFLVENRLAEAAEQMEKIVPTRPQDAGIHNNLGIILTRLDRRIEAEAHFRKATRLEPENALFHQNLGSVLLDMRRAAEAAEHSKRALELQPELTLAMEHLHHAARCLATDSEAAMRDGRKAIELGRFLEQITATNNPAIIGTLAAAYGEAGLFPEAITTAERALRLATGQKNTGLITNLQAQLSLYRTGMPFHDPDATLPK